MILRSPTFRLLVLFFYFYALTLASDAIWKSPRSGEDTLVLNDKYLVEWESQWGPVNLYVFCDGAKYGGVGDNGAMLLYGNYNMSSYLWTVAKVQSCPISNNFHFTVKSADELQGTNSPGFRVIADESARPTNSQSSRSKGLEVGLGVGLGVGIPLFAVAIGVAWYFFVQKARRSRINERSTTQHAASLLDIAHHEQPLFEQHRFPADKDSGHELDASHTGTRGRCELEGSVQ